MFLLTNRITAALAVWLLMKYALVSSERYNSQHGSVWTVLPLPLTPLSATLELDFSGLAILNVITSLGLSKDNAQVWTLQRLKELPFLFSMQKMSKFYQLKIIQTLPMNIRGVSNVYCTDKNSQPLTYNIFVLAKKCSI